MIVQLNDNNNIDNIIRDIPGGKCRKCVLSDNFNERLTPIIKRAVKIEQEENASVYIQVKFDTIYNPRPKRLEIVAKKENKISIYKLTRRSSFEKECIEMQRVIDELNNRYTLSFIGYVVILDLKGNIESYQQRANEISQNIQILI